MKKIFLALVILFCFAMANAENCNFIGNKRSKKYHINTCQMVDRMADKNKICLTSSGEAKLLGFIPCKVCKPNLLSVELTNEEN